MLQKPKLNVGYVYVSTYMTVNNVVHVQCFTKVSFIIIVVNGGKCMHNLGHTQHRTVVSGTLPGFGLLQLMEFTALGNIRVKNGTRIL